MKVDVHSTPLQFIIPLVLVLIVFFTPIVTYADTFYSCVDEDGNEALTNQPLVGHSCKQIGKSAEITEDSMCEKACKNSDDKCGTQIWVHSSCVQACKMNIRPDLPKQSKERFIKAMECVLSARSCNAIETCRRQFEQ